MTPPEACPACGAALEPRQEYCLDCGARILARPRVPHWLWPASAAGLVAAAGAAAAIAAGGDGEATRAIVALPSLRPVPATTDDAGPRRSRILRWPQRDGHTVVVAVVPSTAGRKVAEARARQAIAAGLPEVGILESGRYASLHPGYTLVFSGVYASREDALLALPKVARQFRTAYAQAITR